MSGTRAGVPPETKKRRYRRLTATAKAQTRKLKTAWDRVRTEAARVIAPDAELAEAAAQAHTRYVLKTFVHRETGSRIRVLDTQAADRPPNGLLPMADSDGELLPYAVQCLNHDSEPHYVASYKAATKAVRNSATWCPGCAPVPAMKAKVDRRNKILAKRTP